MKPSCFSIQPEPKSQGMGGWRGKRGGGRGLKHSSAGEFVMILLVHSLSTLPPCFNLTATTTDKMRIKVCLN